MDLAGWRDLALIVIGLFHVIIVLVVGAIAGAVWFFSRKGFKIVDRLLAEKVRPALDTVEMQLLAVRDRTARLHGNEAIGLGEAPQPKQRKLPFPLPFGKKRRRLPFLPS